MTRRPPRSTLFPSTTLSRSFLAIAGRAAEGLLDARKGFEHFCQLGRLVDFPILLRRETDARPIRPAALVGAAEGCRSEEYTSELQSQSNLVCRLLLEKKKIS